MALMSVSEVANLTDAQKSFRVSPVVDLDWITPADTASFPTDYIAGSEGQIKEIVEWADIAKTMLASRTKYYYRNTTYPTKISSIEVGNV
jgi:hypothetical protein